MVFCETSNPAEVGTKGTTVDEEESSSFTFSCLSPKRWNAKAGENNNELADIIDDERLDKNVEAPTEEEEREDKETNESGEVEVGGAAASDDTPTSGEACTSTDNTEVKEVGQDGGDTDKKEDNEKVPVTEGADEQPAVTFAAEQEDTVASPTENKVPKVDIEGGGLLDMPADKAVAGNSLLNLAKNKPKTPKRALFDDDIPDDESEASIEVLFRYMGCTDQVYGEPPVISTTMTMETTGTEYYTVATEASELIENIDTLESAEEDDDAKINTTEATTNDVDFGDVLLSPSGKLLVDADDDEEANKNMDVDGGIEHEKKVVFITEPTPPVDQPDGTTTPVERLDNATRERMEIFIKEVAPLDDQPDEVTSPINEDDKLDDTTPPINEVEKKEIFVKKVVPLDDQPDDDAPSVDEDEQPPDANEDRKLDDAIPSTSEKEEIFIKEVAPLDDQPDDDAPSVDEDEQLDDATPPINEDGKLLDATLEFAPLDDQPGDSTPPDEKLDDAAPPSEVIVESSPDVGKNDESAPSNDQADEITPNDEQSGDEAPCAVPLDGTDEQVPAAEEKVTEEQTSSAEAKPVLNVLTADTKPNESGNIPPQEDSRSADLDSVRKAAVESARKATLALHNVPKYPTTSKTESSDEENACDSELPPATNQDNGTEKEVKTEDTPLEEQGKKEAPTTTLNESGTLSKVEEMDKLIQSTRAWLEKQKAQRLAKEQDQTTGEKDTDNTEATSMGPKNTMNSTLAEVKKLHTSLNEMKSPISTKAKSSAKPLSPRTLDTLLVSRKAPSSTGPKKSILEQLEEIRKKQRDREELSTQSSTLSSFSDSLD